MGDWTSRSDEDPRCPWMDGGAGQAVSGGEQVARLLHSGNSEPEQRRFPREELFPRKGRQPSNECGQSDGASLIRSDTLTDDDLQTRSEKLASSVQGRTPLGAITTRAADLRAIRVPWGEDQQVVFVYDDPSEEEPLHAVLRGRETSNRAEQSELRNEVAKAFAAHVPQREDPVAAEPAREAADRP